MEKKPKMKKKNTHQKRKEKLEVEREALHEMAAQGLKEGKPIGNDCALLKKSQLVDRMLGKVVSKTRKKDRMPFS